MAYTQLKANDKKQAMDEVSRALQLNAGLPEAYSLRGRLAYLGSDMTGAESSFSEAVSLDPGNFDARLWLGTLQREQGRLKEADENLGTALKLRPQDVRARFQFAKLYSDKGDDVSSVKLLEALEKDSPEFIEVHRTLATIYFRLRRPEDGRRERKIAEQMDSDLRKQDEARGRSLTK
jgi:Tfp pilus assembly protein PilF